MNEPEPTCDRRRFLVAGAASLLAGHALQGCASAPPVRSRKLFEISLAEWSLHRALRSGEIDNLDFPARARSFGLSAVEYVNSFFKDKARDLDYLRELDRRCDGEGVRSLLIMCDGEGNLGDPDTFDRARAVENHHRWVEAASALGCHSIRVNARSRGSYEEQQRLAADGLRRLCEYGDRFGIDIIVENHGGLSSNGRWLSETIERVAHPRCGTLPDFGNFRISADEEYDRYRGVDEMMPYARGVSAKSHDFGEDGEEIHTDYDRMLRIVVVAHGYRGHIGIEYEGQKLGEDDGIRATLALLERVRGRLTHELEGEEER